MSWKIRGVEPRFIECELYIVGKMTLREMFPEWWCKLTLSVPENCSRDYNWLDFSIYEFTFTVVIVLVIKWIIYCFLLIIGIIIPDKTVDATIKSSNLLEKEMDIPNDEIEDFIGRDSEFDEDVFSLEEESKKMTKSEEDLVENIDKEIETSIVNITRKEVKK